MAKTKCKKEPPPLRTIKVPKRGECPFCGCMVRPGPCHCGAECFWHHDPFDGISMQATRPMFRYKVES